MVDPVGMASMKQPPKLLIHQLALLTFSRKVLFSAVAEKRTELTLQTFNHTAFFGRGHRQNQIIYIRLQQMIIVISDYSAYYYQQ